MEQHILNALNELMEAYRSIGSDRQKASLRSIIRRLKEFFKMSFPDKVLEFDVIKDEYHCYKKEVKND